MLIIFSVLEFTTDLFSYLKDGVIHLVTTINNHNTTMSLLVSPYENSGRFSILSAIPRSVSLSSLKDSLNMVTEITTLGFCLPGSSSIPYSGSLKLLISPKKGRYSTSLLTFLHASPDNNCWILTDGGVSSFSADTFTLYT